MKFYKPQVELAKIVDPNAPTEFVLHSVIFCRYTNYKANGYETDLTDLEDGVVAVTLKLDQDINLPEFEFITPVVHTINLGAINFPEGDGWIDIDVVGAVIEEEGEGRGTDTVSKTTKPGSKTTVSTAHSTTKTKPGDLLI